MGGIYIFPAILFQYKSRNKFDLLKTLPFGCQGNRSESGADPNMVKTVKGRMGQVSYTCWSSTARAEFYWLTSPCKWLGRFTASWFTIIMIETFLPNLTWQTCITMNRLMLYLNPEANIFRCRNFLLRLTLLKCFLLLTFFTLGLDCQWFGMIIDDH